MRKGSSTSTLETLSSLQEGANDVALAISQDDVDSISGGTGDLFVNLVVGGNEYDGVCVPIREAINLVQFEETALTAYSQEDYNALTDKTTAISYSTLKNAVLKFTRSDVTFTLNSSDTAVDFTIEAETDPGQEGVTINTGTGVALHGSNFVQDGHTCRLIGEGSAFRVHNIALFFPAILTNNNTCLLYTSPSPRDS